MQFLTCPMVTGTSAAGGPGRRPPRDPLAKPLEYTRRQVPFSCPSVEALALPPSSGAATAAQRERSGIAALERGAMADIRLIGDLGRLC